MKYLLILAAIAVLLASCTEGQKNEEVSLKDTLTYTFPIDSKIEFSGYTWEVIEKGETSDILSDINLSKSENVYTDNLGRLYLKIKRIDGIWYGAELISKDIFGLGDYIFHLDSNSIEIDSLSTLSLSAQSSYQRRFSGLLEAGMRFYGTVVDPPDGFIEYYTYTTEHKYASVEYPKVSRKSIDRNSIHIISVQSGLLSYANRLGDELDKSKFLAEFSIDKSNQTSNDSEDRITFQKPNPKMRASIKFSINDFENTYQKDEIIVRLSKFVFLSPEIIAEK